MKQLSRRCFLSAYEKFIEDIEKFELIYKSDFRYAIYAELVKIMDEREIVNYPIRTEHRYEDNEADFSLGKNHEVAVEFKFTSAYELSPFSALREGKEQLKRYLNNGAKKAYLVYLDLPPSERDPASRLIYLEDLGLSGKWKNIKGRILRRSFDSDDSLTCVFEHPTQLCHDEFPHVEDGTRPNQKRLCASKMYQKRSLLR